jgi:hypothetical protein
MKKIRAVILGNELPGDHHLWQRACEEFSERIEWRVVDLTGDDWLEAVEAEPCDILLAKPGGLTASFKQLYDERVYILGKVLGHPVYPSVEEILVYENKRFLSFWLKANHIPHPATHVFYDRAAALRRLESEEFPVVAKTGIGASGSGVRILGSRMEAARYVDLAFSPKGAARRTGPNLASGGLLRRGLHYVLHPGGIRRKLGIFRALRSDVQKGFVILQEFVPHEFEWRAVRIGDSFFAHKKLKSGGKASGSLLKGYENPPLQLLDFVRDITERHGFFSQAVDVFESDRGYLVNEMQCIFGQSDPFQMRVDGRPGRYLWKGGRWAFEEGDFNRNESYNLRVEYAIDFMRKKGGRHG